VAAFKVRVRRVDLAIFKLIAEVVGVETVSTIMATT